MAPHDFGYCFDPTEDYQPRIVNEFVICQNGKVRINRDGTVQINPDSDTAHIDVLEVSRHPKGYNQYAINGWGFQAYKSAAYQLWPKRPKELTWVDHVDRDRENDSFDNLRPVNASLNNLNQYRASTKGYIHETQEWVDKVNGYRAKKGEPLLILKEPPRNMYISCCTYKGKRYEFGAFHYPEEATACYRESKEPFIQARLRDIWTAFLFTK